MLPGIALAALATLSLGLVLGPEALLIAIGSGVAVYLHSPGPVRSPTGAGDLDRSSQGVDAGQGVIAVVVRRDPEGER